MSVFMKTNTALGRRQVLQAVGAGAVALVGSGFASNDAMASADAASKYLMKMAGGAAKEGKVTLKLPEIAENGATVPITISVDSPMTDSNYVKFVHVVAEGNPNPEVVTFSMSPGMGKAEVSTRLRLSKTQNVRAVAVMSDGSIYGSTKQVKVTIGGCGG